MRRWLTAAAMLLGFAGSVAPTLSDTTHDTNAETAAACWNQELHKTDPKKANYACDLLNEMAEESYCHLARGPEQAEANRRAANAGDADAQYVLGCMYRWGAGVPRDEAEMWKWWRRAADQGQFRANARLIDYYQTRHEPVEEYVCIARVLEHWSADYDDEDAAERAASRLPSLVKSMTPAQLEEAKAKALVATRKPAPE
jgi:TPR repeat protein